MLKLYAENDRLKINELDNKKKIAHLLALAGPAAEECSYFLRDPPNHVSGIMPIKPDKENKTQFDDRSSGIGTSSSLEINEAGDQNLPRPKTSEGKITSPYKNKKPQIIKQASGVNVVEPMVAQHKKKFSVLPNGAGKHAINPSNAAKSRYKHEKFGKKLNLQNKIFDDRQIFVLQIEALQSQLEEQTKLARDQIATLTDDRKISMEEFEAARKKDQIKIQNLNENLRKTQQLLTDATKDFLKVKTTNRHKEKVYMQEKDALCLELDELRDKLAGKNNYDPILKTGGTKSVKDGRSLRRTNGSGSNLLGGINTAARANQDALRVGSFLSEIFGLFFFIFR